MAKKTSKSSKKSKDPSLNWYDQAQTILNQLVQASKKKGACVCVFSPSGDLILQSGLNQSIDQTSLGALVAGLYGARKQLESFFKLSSNIHQGYYNKNLQYWIEDRKDWLVLGIKCSKTKGFEKLYQHLKKRPSTSAKANMNEALDGLSEAAVEQAFQK